MKIYRGKLRGKGIGREEVITVEDEKRGRSSYPLMRINRHSLDGSQGYIASEQADLALSILTDCVGRETAEKFYQHFRNEFVSGWGEEWSVGQYDILVWLTEEGRGGGKKKVKGCPAGCTFFCDSHCT